MSVDVLGIAALGAVAIEWLGLGWLSGVRMPSEASCVPWGAMMAATWSARLLLGACLVAVAQLLLSTIGLGFRFVPGVLLLAALGAIAVRWVMAAAEKRCAGPVTTAPPLEKTTDSSRREQVGWLLLALLVCVALLRSLLIPESGWDAYSHWGLRAQAFANAGTLVDAHSEHEYYPPLVPLLEAWLYLHRGLVSIDLGKTVWALVGGAFTICLGWHLRLGLREGETWLAPYLAGAIVLLTPELLDGFWTGQADLPLTVFLCLATLGLWQWQRTSDRRWLVQVGVFGAAAALTKFEGLPRIGLVCLALLVEVALARWSGAERLARFHRWQPTAVAVASPVVPAVAVWLVWTAFQVTHAIPANAEHIGRLQPFALGGVLVALAGVFAGVRTGGGLLVAVGAWVIAAAELARPALRLLALIVTAQAIGTLLAFLVSATSPEVQVQTSATRLVAQFLPIALAAGALGLLRTAQPIIAARDEDSARRENDGSRRA